MKRSGHLNGILFASASMLLLCAWPNIALTQDTDEPHVSVGFSKMEFLHSINILAKSVGGIVIKYDASLCNPTTQDVDLKKIDIPETVSLSLEDQPVGKVLQSILNKAYTPLTYKRMGDIYTIIRDPSRKAAPHPNKPADTPPPGSQNLGFRNVSFDVAIERLFQSYHLRYAIQPDVPVIREAVTINVVDATADEALTALLGSVSTGKAALIYRFDGGKYVIANREGSGSATELLPPTLPNGGWDLDLTGVPLDAALENTFRAKQLDYYFAGSLTGDKSVDLHRHFNSEEAAVVAILRSAQANPTRIYRKEGNLVTLLSNFALPPGLGPVPSSITCHCTNMDFATLVSVIFREFGKNFRGAGQFQHVPVTLSLDHVSFDEAYKALCKALPPNSVQFKDNMYTFGK